MQFLLIFIFIKVQVFLQLIKGSAVYRLSELSEKYCLCILSSKKKAAILLASSGE